MGRVDLIIIIESLFVEWIISTNLSMLFVSNQPDLSSKLVGVAIIKKSESFKLSSNSE